MDSPARQMHSDGLHHLQGVLCPILWLGSRAGPPVGRRLCIEGQRVEYEVGEAPSRLRIEFPTPWMSNGRRPS